MIHFNFSIINYFRRKYTKQTDYVCIDRHLFGHKHLEIQISHWGQAMDLISLTLSTPITGQDHAGIMFHLDILGYGLIINFYDNRHWDHDKNTWETYNDDDNYLDNPG